MLTGTTVAESRRTESRVASETEPVNDTTTARRPGARDAEKARTSAFASPASVQTSANGRAALSSGVDQTTAVPIHGSLSTRRDIASAAAAEAVTRQLTPLTIARRARWVRVRSSSGPSPST